MPNSILLLLAFLSTTLSSCSVDFVPVHYSRVNALLLSHKPLERGPNAPGAFKRTWYFKEPKGYLFDPSRIELKEGNAHLLNPQKQKWEIAVLETETGFPYAAIDSFRETSTALGFNPRGQSGQTGAALRASIRYQLSPNGSKWYWHNGTAWVEAERSQSQTNSAVEINAHISTFHSEVGPGVLQLKAFLIPAPEGSSNNVALQEISIEGVAPRLDGWH